MSYELEKLRKHRDALLLAEVGAWLHNFGKYSEEFLYSQFAASCNAIPADYASFKYQHIVGIVADAYTVPGSSLSPTAEQRLRDMLGTWDVDKTLGFLLDKHPDFVRWLRDTTFRLPPPLDERDYAVGEIVEFQDYKWYRGSTPLIAELFPAGSKATELFEFSHNAGSGVEKEGIGSDGVQDKLPAYASTAFGYEHALPVEKWRQGREKIIATLTSKLTEQRGALRPFFQQALGDTRYPINEVTLWDLSASIAAFYKAALAKVNLERQWTNRNDFRWRILRVAVDQLAFCSQAHRLPDLLARKTAVSTALDQVQTLLEETYPIGNEVYRDETGSAFLVPDLSDDDQAGARIKDLLEPEIQHTLEYSSIGNEILPRISVSRAEARGLTLASVLAEPPPVPQAKPNQLALWWQEARGVEVCPVCGLRPQEPVQEARQRKVCNVCEQRRVGRAKKWATKELHTTIWTDEVADTNGRLALIVGTFDLSHWLDGSFVRTLAVIDPAKASDKTADAVAKNPSFARIRRVWETTRTFWQEITECLQKKDSALVPMKGHRLAIMPKNAASLDLGPFYAYELVVEGIRLSVVWDKPNGRFITADNLDYLAGPEQLGKPVDTFVQPGKRFQLEEPAGYGSANRKLGFITIEKVEEEDAAYAPVIPILAEPRTFMALVPADRALDVVQAIKQKYEREIGKVRNRLPLHLGIVYAHRRTPLRAVLDAGRRMLRQKSLGQAGTWQVAQDVLLQQGDLPETARELADGTLQFAQWYAVKLKQDDRQLTWYVPAVMGDGSTPDDWYPYVFVKADKDGNLPAGRQHAFRGLRPTEGGTEESWLVHAGELKGGDTVYFTPATLDWVWLDSSARRFEVAYDEHGRRRGQLTRPYLLDELEVLDEIWQALSSSLTSTQIHALREFIEGKREGWPTGDKPVDETDPVFRQFCRDALANSNWKGKPWDDDKRAWLDRWAGYAARGWLSDVIELHMQILKQKPETEKEAKQ